jgi:hypothetical protein
VVSCTQLLLGGCQLAAGLGQQEPAVRLLLLEVCHLGTCLSQGCLAASGCVSQGITLLLCCLGGPPLLLQLLH